MSSHAPDIVAGTISRRHRWNDTASTTIPACEAADGNDRTEKTCMACGLVKITVHPPRGLPWREWRTAAGGVWTGQATPPCVEAKAGAGGA